MLCQGEPMIGCKANMPWPATINGDSGCHMSVYSTRYKLKMYLQHDANKERQSVHSNQFATFGEAIANPVISGCQLLATIPAAPAGDAAGTACERRVGSNMCGTHAVLQPSQTTKNASLASVPISASRTATQSKQRCAVQPH